MKTTLQTLHIKDKELLVSKLIASGYAFAIWRMPNESEVSFIVSLSPPKQVHSTLAETQSGFLINRFSDNHPNSPFLIEADILIKEEEIVINPVMTSEKIDAFVTALSKTPAKLAAPYVDLKSFKKTPFENLVAQAVKEIRAGAMEKIVLSRFADERLKEGFSPWNFFQEVNRKYPQAFCSATHIPQNGLWIGATPELLLSDNTERFKTVSLAGTKQLASDENLGEIAWTQKEIEEQALVSRYIINCFKKIRLREFHEHGPKTVRAGSLAHLKTDYEVHYNEVQFEQLADQMLALLHPTSAVCGMPLEKVIPAIKNMENYDREFYAGFLGPVNMYESTDLFVNLRCIKIANGAVRIYAGAGITEDSIPHKEYDETEMKMGVMKACSKCFIQQSSIRLTFAIN